MAIVSRPVKTVLIVDDDKDCLFSLKLMLESLGFTVEAYETPHALLTAIDRLHPHLVLVDLMMPKMDGFSLIHELKRKPTMQNVPIVVVTAREEENDIEEVFERGADYYITKPFTAKQLESRIQLFLASEDGSSKSQHAPETPPIHRPRRR